MVLKRALSDGIIQRLTTEGLRPLKVTTVRRSLFTAAELEKLCKTAFSTKTSPAGKAIPITENAQQFTDYIRLMCYSGARRKDSKQGLLNDFRKLFLGRLRRIHDRAEKNSKKPPVPSVGM